MERRSALLATASTQVVEFDIDNYLTIVALEDGLTASLSVNDVEYCIDGNGNWSTLTAGTTSPAINKNQYISFRGNLTPTSSAGVGPFTISISCDLTGNCNSLLFGDDAKTNLSLSGKSYAFYRLFYNCSTIKNVSPNFLPATTLGYMCYDSMFQDCTSLTTAPQLPATTLADYCYRYMFKNCSKLNYIKAMFITTPSSSYTNNWVSGVASSGTFVKNKNATWNVTGVNGIPSGWTVINNS